MSNSGRFAVVTPYHKEERKILERCIDSVNQQTVPADHFLISDGFPQDWLDSVDVKHVKLDHAYRDWGNTPRCVGALLAVSESYEGIGLLDADNWYDANHVSECCSAAGSDANTPADLVIARRRIFLPDSTPVPVREEPGHVDTSCFWFLEGSFHLLHHWMMVAPVAPICDRIFYGMIKAHNLSVHHTNNITVNYTGDYAPFYTAVGRAPLPTTKSVVNIQAMADWVAGLSPRRRKVVHALCGVDPLSVIKEIGAPPRLRRNDACYCGSGKKYKYCHGAFATT